MTNKNHPAHGTVSLDRLLQIREHLQHDTQYSNGGNRAYILADVLKVIDGAIAAFGAEPVAYMHRSGQVVTREECCDDKTFAICCKVETPLYSAPPVPVVPDEKPMPEASKMHAIDAVAAIAEVRGWNACRAAMLQDEPVSQPYKLPPNSFTDEELEGMAHGDNPQSNAYRELLVFRRNSPVTPDGWVMVPKKLTAENGAKAALLGEFNLEYTLTCHECFGEGCDDCSGEGTWLNTIPVDWTTIKDIWAKAIDHFSAAPLQEDL
ncbi:hypothetical protein RYZ90_18860 [Citrobacter portucalensis]|uniref:Eaa protein n=1 Tax=Citrobacter portucalensis TaxID=1639133 RepID=A0ABD5H2Y7_9ENTR|nr:hypothetical protein [Citrobacter portucalensis]MDW2635909.1 hypothetical protein [Citrobacter portucalensis]